MNVPRREGKPLRMGLFVSIASSALVLVGSALATDGQRGPYVRMDDAGEEEAFLMDEALKLEEVLVYAQQRNPAIRAGESRLLAAQKVPAQASAYEDPTLTWEAWNAPEDFRINEADNNIFTLSQKIPFPGKLRLRGQIASKEAERVEAELRATEIDTEAQLKKAYYDLWLVYRTLEVYRRDQALVAQFVRIAEQKYAVGQVSQSDVLRAHVEHTRLINRVTTETLALGKAAARLNALVSRPPEARLGIPEDPPSPGLPYAMAELEERTLRNRPELLAQARALDKERLGLALTHKAYYPDFEVSMSRFVNSDAQDGFGVMVSASIPLAFKYKYDAAVEETSANLQAAQSELWRARDLALFEVKQAFVEAQTALEQVNLFLYTHVPQAEQALQASQMGYQTGALDFLSLIDSVRAIEQIHLEHLGAVADFERAWAELERAVGQKLPRTVLSGTKRNGGADREGADSREGVPVVLSGASRRERNGTCEARSEVQCQEEQPGAERSRAGTRGSGAGRREGHHAGHDDRRQHGVK